MSREIRCASCNTLLIVLASGSKVSPNGFACCCSKCYSKLISKATANGYNNSNKDILDTIMGIFK